MDGRLLRALGVSARMGAEAIEHGGIHLQFGDERHLVPMREPIPAGALREFSREYVEPCSTAGCSSPATRRNTVPPTGAKGLNLASSDVAILGAALVALCRDGDATALASCSARTLRAGLASRARRVDDLCEDRLS